MAHRADVIGSDNIVRNNGRSLRQAIALRNGDAYRGEKFGQFRCQRRTPGNKHSNAPTNSLAELFVNDLVRNPPLRLDRSGNWTSIGVPGDGTFSYFHGPVENPAT